MKKSCIISHYCQIRDHAVIGDDETLYERCGADLSDFFTGIYQHFDISYPKFYKMDNLCKLGFLSVELLLMDRNIQQRYAGHEVGIILMNASSSLDNDRHHQQTILDRSAYFPSPAVFVYTLPNIVIGEICIRHKFTGEGTFFVRERFDPLFLFNYVNQLFYQDVVQCCIAGWVETLGDYYDSTVYLIEKTGKPDAGITIFEPDTIKHIFAKEK
ncbi:MAG: hypothetical protein JXR41_01035 [Bacteroidales bacterium]|nr:hypothetical protein [Bacteroidales bacterium]MBN2761644.1 hypothetical protein [Bacteroidales bacterium]